MASGDASSESVCTAIKTDVANIPLSDNSASVSNVQRPNGCISRENPWSRVPGASGDSSEMEAGINSTIRDADFPTLQSAVSHASQTSSSVSNNRGKDKAKKSSNASPTEETGQNAYKNHTTGGSQKKKWEQANIECIFPKPVCFDSEIGSSSRWVRATDHDKENQQNGKVVVDAASAHDKSSVASQRSVGLPNAPNRPRPFVRFVRFQKTSRLPRRQATGNPNSGNFVRGSNSAHRWSFGENGFYARSGSTRPCNSRMPSVPQLLSLPIYGTNPQQTLSPAFLPTFGYPLFMLYPTTHNQNAVLPGAFNVPALDPGASTVVSSSYSAPKSVVSEGTAIPTCSSSLATNPTTNRLLCTLLPGSTIAQPTSLCFLATSCNDPVILIRHQILHQVEFYFCIENLAKDVFLRKHMDQDGWVNVSVIAGFKRIASLSSDLNEILEAIRVSPVLDVDVEHARVRCKDCPQMWVLPSAARSKLDQGKSTNLNPDAPEFVPSNISPAGDAGSSSQASQHSAVGQEELNFSFTTETQSGMDQPQKEAVADGVRTSILQRTRTYSATSDEDLDDTMLSGLLVIAPSAAEGTRYSASFIVASSATSTTTTPSSSLSTAEHVLDAIVEDLCKSVSESKLDSDAVPTSLSEPLSVITTSTAVSTVRVDSTVCSPTQEPLPSVDPNIQTPSIMCPASFFPYHSAPYSAPPHVAAPAPVLFPGMAHGGTVSAQSFAFPSAAGLPTQGAVFLTPFGRPYANQPSPFYYLTQMNPYQPLAMPFPGSPPMPPNVMWPVDQPQQQAPKQDIKGRIAGFFPVTKGTISPPARRIFPRKRCQSGGEYTSSAHSHVGFLLHPSQAAPRSDTIDEKSTSADFLHSHQKLIQQKGFTFHAYNQFRSKCLKDRESKGKGLSQEMNVLYSFWSFFLREHFNQSMYKDFKKHALDDAKNGARYGMECLFRFYSYGLEKRFRKGIFKDFQEETLREYDEGQLYGLEKFWAFLHYSHRKVVIDERLQDLLNNKYRNLEDFRVNFQPPVGFFVDKSRRRTKSESASLGTSSHDPASVGNVTSSSAA